MPTSELSDALNPHLVPTRARNNATAYSSTLQPVVQQPQHYVPHRSELEIAISEPPRPPPTRSRAPPSPEVVNTVQELLRMLATAREGQEIERKRRLAWEQEQEAKYTQRQAETERQMFEMRQEINSLRASIQGNPRMQSGLLTPQFNGSPVQTPQQPFPPAPSSVPQVSTQSAPMFSQLQVHSSQSRVSQQYRASTMGNVQPQAENMAAEPPSPSATPSPQIVASEASSSRPRVSSSQTTRRKRRTVDLSSQEEDGGSSDSDVSVLTSRPIKRTCHHDKRCLTIQHAMRAHILKLMYLDSDKSLPDSHVEGATLAPDDPIRFVWDKTPKQSVHNGRMKSRILDDLKSNRRSYKHVSEKEFNKKVLDSVFDQAFVTLRQKHKAQTDAQLASGIKKREAAKSRKARRLGRKKMKLSNRADVRMKMTAFEHIIFDGALQPECMSSEESDCDDDDNHSSGRLRTRGLPWRSSRLKRFYGTLDEEEWLDKSTKPKRGVGKKERYAGPPKEGLCMPPKGVASWMISKRWIKQQSASHPDLVDVLKNIVEDPPEDDLSQVGVLGEESGDEQANNMQEPQSYYVGDTGGAQSTSSSSLHNALATPVS